MEQDARLERGRQMATDKRIKRVAGAMWMVPSQTGSTGAGYLVNTKDATCTCPDHEGRKLKCKHQWAVELSQTIEVKADGTRVVTETVKITRKTYSQKWPEYNAAQCAEKATVQRLLRDLCDGIWTPPHPGRGPKPLPLADAVYGMAMKVYTTASARRATSDIEACRAAGHIDEAPHYNSIINYFGKEEITPLLQALIAESASPLQQVESKFAIDSTGFGTSVYRRWFDHKHGREMKESTWVKAHAMIGTHTNIVTACLVTDERGADPTQLPALLAETAERFTMREVSADKAYLSKKNLDAIEGVGAIPYIPFKKNSQGKGPAAWRRMHAMFTLNEADFLAHYHQRSNVEATFGAIKKKFGGAVRSKTFTAQVNEVLCKVLCHNLSMLVHAMFELKIEPAFNTKGLTL